jgi:hypothetical protein
MFGFSNFLTMIMLLSIIFANISKAWSWKFKPLVFDYGTLDYGHVVHLMI